MWQDFPLGFYRLFGLALVLLAAFWFAICLVEYVSFVRWRREGRRCILRGEMVYYGHRRREGQDVHFFRERRQLYVTGIGVLLLFVLMTVSGLRYTLYLSLFNVVIWLALGCIDYRWSLTSGRKKGRMVRAGVTAVLSVSLLAMMVWTGIEPQWTYNRMVKRESIDADRAGLHNLWLLPTDYRQEETSLYFMPRVSGEIGLLGRMEKIDLAISEQYIVSYEQYYSPFTWLLEQTEQKLIVSGGWYEKKEALSAHWQAVSGLMLSNPGGESRRYVIRYSDRVLVINEKALTDEQIDHIVKKIRQGE